MKERKEMITLCTVLVEELRPFMNLMIDSLLRKNKLVSNILIAHVNSPYEYTQERHQQGVRIETFSHLLPHGLDTNEFGHALGLHACIEKANTPYVMFCDPDVLFIEDTPSFYLDLMKKLSLNYIGCSHECAVQHPETYFPYVVNSLVKKADLPNDDFMKNLLYYRGNLTARTGDTLEDLGRYQPSPGKYLIRGFIPGTESQFPNAILRTEKIHTIDFDTGHLLYLWSLQQKWRWLSFLTPDVHFYNTGYYRSNCGVKLPSDKKPLIYHLTGRYRKNGKGIDDFISQYASIKERND